MAKKTIQVTLYMSELLYDVQNKTHLTGRSREDKTNHEFVANMKVNDDEDDENQIIRSIGYAFSVLKTKLSEYINEAGTTASNKQISATTNLQISLVMPSNYNQAMNDSIAAASHQYIVNIAIGNWFTITNKGDASDYIALSAINLEDIREALNKRVRPTRPNVS